MKTITVERVARPTSLYVQYEHQTSNQPCYVELDCKHAALSADYNGEIGTAVPMSVWHGHTLRWSIPALVARRANELLHEIAPLAQRVIDGYSSEWDGNNHVAHYTEDAEAAQSEIDALCENLHVAEGDVVEAWDAEDWLYGGDVHDKITHSTTDEEIDALVDEIESELQEWQIVYNVRDYLCDIRIERIEAANAR